MDRPKYLAISGGHLCLFGAETLVAGEPAMLVGASSTPCCQGRALSLEQSRQHVVVPVEDGWLGRHAHARPSTQLTNRTWTALSRATTRRLLRTRSPDRLRTPRGGSVCAAGPAPIPRI